MTLGIVLCGARATQNAVANGDTRTLTIRHMHTKEETTVTFKRDGRYVSEALEKLNWALRDWRTDEPIRMDPRLFDLAWEVHRAVGSEQPFHVVSAYRAPGTNAMLRRRSRAVAKHSQHTLGKAMDFYLPDTPTARIREAGMRLQRGGVGFYPGAHTPFVHLDAGSVRSWPRMTRDQLVRLFPDEKTVHLPADGKPLDGYELARADILARGGAVAGYGAADLDEGAVISSGGKSLWASLFGGDDEEADSRPTRGRARAPRQQPAVLVYATPAHGDGNSNDGGRFAVAAAPAPPADALLRERTNRLAPKPVEPQAPQIASLAGQAASPASQPRLIDTPLPLARPRGLALPPSAAESVQVAALAQAGCALAFAPQPGLPPRRPDAIGALIAATAPAAPILAPIPPARPAAFGSLAGPGLAAELGLRGPGDDAPAPPQGRLVSVSHPMPPGRPRSETAVAAAATADRHTPIVARYDADRGGLDALFAVVAQAPPDEAKATRVALARTRPTTPLHAIQSPSPAAALGFSHVAPNDAGTSSFSGPAVKPLPTNFVQN